MEWKIYLIEGHTLGYINSPSRRKTFMAFMMNVVANKDILFSVKIKLVFMIQPKERESNITKGSKSRIIWYFMKQH